MSMQIPSVDEIRKMGPKARQRLYNRLYHRAERDLKGGCQYGIDWPTLSMVKPRLAEAMKACANPSIEGRREASPA